MFNRYLVTLLLACAALHPKALAQAEYLAPVPDYDLQSQAIERWSIGEYLYFVHPSLVAFGNSTYAVPELWVVHLPSGQSWRVDFPEGDQFRMAAQQGDALYCYASTEPVHHHLYRLENGAIQHRTSVPKIERLVPVPEWGKGIGFIAEDASSVWQWWMSDGTAAGTDVRVEGIGANASFAALGDQLIFMGPDNQLYTSDGTTTGTIPIAELGQAATNFRSIGPLLLFNLGEQTWRTDGTEAGTYALVPHRNALSVSVVGGTAVILMKRLSNNINEVWSTDGTLAGTRLLLEMKEAYPQVFALGGHHYIMGRAVSSEQFHCWRFDGSPGSTPIALPNSALHHLNSVIRVVHTQEGWVLLEGSTESAQRTVLIFDGDEAYPVDYWPATSLFSFGEEWGWYPPLAWPHLHYFSGHIYMPMQYAHLGVELWRIGSDGSTELVADVAPGVRWSHPRPLATWSGQLYFLGKSPELGPGLFRTPAQGQAELPPLAADYNWLQALSPSRSQFSLNEHHTIFSSQVATSTAGHVYVGGESTRQAGLAFPGQQVILPPAMEWLPNLNYVAKLDGTTGRLQWARQLAFDYTKHLSFDVLLAPAPDDGVYLSNIFTAAAVFEDTLIQTHGRQTYLTHLDSSGRGMWHITAELGPQGGPLGIMAGKDGNLYFLGSLEYYQGRFGDALLSSPHSSALFLAQVSPEGKVLDIFYFDLPFSLQQIKGTAAMQQSPDGSIIVSLSERGVNHSQTCGFRPSIILLCRISGDLKHMVWKRELVVDDLAYANALALSPDGLIYLAGPYRGDFTVDGETISAPCELPSSFIALFNGSGRLMQLNDLEQGQTAIHDLQFEDSGTYLLAGIERHEERERRYAGYAEFPFARGRLTTFVQRRCPHRHKLLDERRFLKPNDDDFHLHHPRLAVMPSGDIVLQDRLQAGSIMDTLAGIPLMSREDQAVLLNFELPAIGYCPELADLWADVPLNFSMAPNPTRDYTWLSTPLELDAGLLRLSLKNMAGQTVPLREVGGDRAHRQLDLSSLPAGVYVLSVQFGSRQDNLKIVKQ